jgi:hypothetical protein
VLHWYTDQTIYDGYFKSMDSRMRKFWETIIWVKSVPNQQLEAIFGYPVLEITQQYSSYSIDLIKDLRERFRDFLYVSRYRQYYYHKDDIDLGAIQLKVEIPSGVRLVMGLYMSKPQGYYLDPIQSIPPGYIVVSMEKEIFNDLPLLLSYQLQDNIKFTNKGYLSLPSVKKMSKTLTIKEFFDPDPYCIRSLMLAGFLGNNRVKLDNNKLLDFIKDLFSADITQHNNAPYFLPQLKGFNNINNYYFSHDATVSLMYFFRNIIPTDWFTFANLNAYISFRFLDLLPLKEYDFEHRIKFELDVRNSQNKPERLSRSLNTAVLPIYVETPYLAAHIFWLASWGLMDVAINEKIKCQYSPYDQLYAFRLTKLGEYVLGRINEYTPPITEAKTALTFDENSLFIRVDGSLRLGDTMLDKFAVKVSENRYQFSPGKFMKECKCPSDLKDKIMLFKKIVAQKLPQFWENYLDQLIVNSKIIKNQHNMHVFSLPADNKELHRLVAQDEQLRKLIIKAEKFYVIVEHNHVSAFFQRMKEIGYLVDHYMVI